MKAISHLPAGYRQIDSIDLQKDKKPPSPSMPSPC